MSEVLRVFAGNFNIDATIPPSVDVLATFWLQAHYDFHLSRLSVPPPVSLLNSSDTKTSSDKISVSNSRINFDPDIYVIGFQEVKHFVEGDDVLNFEPINHNAWHQASLDAINYRSDGSISSDPYVSVKQVIYSSVLLSVFAKRSIVETRLKNVALLTTKLHDGVMTGKKGICGVEFEMENDFKFCCLTAHFQAYSEKLDERIWDANVVQECLWSSGLTTVQHDVAILAGDLNYRIILPIDQVKEAIAKSEFEHLLDADELLCHSSVMERPGRSSHKGLSSPNVDLNKFPPVFNGWKESHILFAPTYKFVNGTDRWDDSGKQRTPAWCDRILTYGSSDIVYYTSAPLLTQSDHRPIIALINVKTTK